MFKQTLISQSYVLIDNKEFTLKYYLLQDFNYGVLVEKLENGSVEKKTIKSLTNNYEQILSFIHSIAKGFVTPSVLDEIVEDSFVLSPYDVKQTEPCPA